MNEGAELVRELLAQPSDILDAALVGDPRDDGAHAQIARIVLAGQSLHRRPQHLVALRVRRNERALHHLARPRRSLRQIGLQQLAARPPVDRLRRLELLERPAHTTHRVRGTPEPIEIEHDGAYAEDPELAWVVQTDGECRDHRYEKHEPGERTR